jgi:hypothetical protein
MACSLILAACSSGQSPSASNASGNDLKYGASPQQVAGITYQPDVVLVGGSGSVTAVSANGLLWTISGSAPNVGELRPGKILFASSLGVGRILAVRKAGSDTQVVLGPVNITDVVRDGNFSSTTPVSLSAPESYSASEQPGALTQLVAYGAPAGGSISGSDSNTVTVPPVHLVANLADDHASSALPGLALTPGSGGLPSPSRSPSSSSVGAYHFNPFCCAGGVGVHVGYDNKGLKLSATVTLHLEKPTVGFDLKIEGGKLVNAAVVLHGAGGFGIHILATSTTGLAGDVKEQHVDIPVDFSVPISAFGIPLTVGFDQVFGMAVAFTAHPSEFKADGTYTFSGDLGFGIHNGSPSVYVPEGVKPIAEPSSDMNLVSVGPAAMAINYQAKISVGIGFLGFRTGVYFALAVNTGLTAGGAVSEFNCRTASLAIFDEYGVGYIIPKPVAALINTFLKVFGAPPIKAKDGFARGPFTVLTKTNTTPSIAACVPSS